MRVFVCEYVTSGGLRHKSAGEALVPEALLIRDALVRDLESVPGVTVVVTHDDRLPPALEDSIPVLGGDDPWALWERLAGEADVVWPVAPESDGLLARLAALCRSRCEKVIASAPAAIMAASSKLMTARRLAAHGLPFIPTFPATQVPDDLAGPILIKPERGCGCADIRIFPSRAEVPAFPSFVAQPFLAGEAASLSLLCRPDGTTLLAANRQHVVREGDGLVLDGLTVGAYPDADGAFARLGQAVAEAFAGLSGIVGIDLLLTETGPVVVEVNPRVTTAYAGVHAALGVNPAAFLPELIREGVLPAVPHLPRPRPVEVRIR